MRLALRQTKGRGQHARKFYMPPRCKKVRLKCRRWDSSLPANLFCYVWELRDWCAAHAIVSV